MRSERLDDFADVSGWSPIASGRARLDLSRAPGRDGHALRLDFDFGGSGGFVVARKAFARALPERYAFCFDVRGEGPANRLEWKLVDPSGRNVWWARREAFAPPADWQAIRIASREIEFAWGPAGGGSPHELGALELAIVAGPGGRGSLWIEDLCFEDLAYRAQPIVTTSRSDPPWLAIDFQEQRELGGLVLNWEPGSAPRSFEAAVSNDGRRWSALASPREVTGSRSYLYTPGTEARHLRIDLRAQRAGDRVGLRDVDTLPLAASRSLPAFFAAIAERERRGLYPRYLLAEQCYWTPVGVSGAHTCALLGETGMLEVDRGSFSLEPFLFADGELVTWADAAIETGLAEGWLPIPTVVWRARGLRLAITAFATGPPERPVLFATYRLAAESAAPRRAALLVALRPFQVTPPWQSFGELGGTSPIRELAFHGGAVLVNDTRAVVPQVTPDGFGAAAFARASFPECLERGELPGPEAVRDDAGLASGALRFDLELAPGSAREIAIAVPFGPDAPSERDVAAMRARSPARELAAAREDWQREVAGVAFRVPEAARACIDALRTAVAHVLLVRDGPALQPGPRRYTRSWIRDAATMCAALLRLGRADPVRDFLRWYTPFQARDGNVPCCVDRGGPDWLPEHDSHGQLIFAIAEHFRFTGDRALAAEWWPAVRGAADYLAGLRARRLTPDYAAPEKRAFYGILPESVSHEGYLAHPVHAYWDDFWALRGLGDAVELALALGHGSEAQRIGVQREGLRECLYASIAATMAARGLDTLPASVEWADFDPSASAVALSLSDAIECLPSDALARTYDQYLSGFRRRRSGELDWANYTPYEIRILGALVRLGRRAEAHELLEAFLADRRPLAWNQWPEIAWRDPRSPGHLGDLPHTWIGAEYALAVLSLFAYERIGDGALVIGAGIPEAWLADGFELAVADLPTAFGTLGLRMHRPGGDRLVVELSGALAPPGGVVLVPPLPRPLRRVAIDGVAVTGFEPDRVALPRAPATVVLHH